MIIEINTELMSLFSLSINELVLLGLLSSKNQKKNQELQAIFSHVSNCVENLIAKDLIVPDNRCKLGYNVTQKVLEYNSTADPNFDEFLLNYPEFIVRPNGIREYLHVNLKKARAIYKEILKESTNMHSHIIQCLKAELSEKINTGRLGYMKRMLAWLQTRQWEAYEHEVEQPIHITPAYGTDIKW